MNRIPDQAMTAEAARIAAACAARLRLPLRDRVWRGAAGGLSGAGSGSSLDFQDHRAYLPGDDPRHINWAAYARTGQYSMKLFREEVRPTVEVLFDASPSMFLNEEKARRSCELLVFACEAARRDEAALTIHLLDGPRCQPLDIARIESGGWVGHVAAAGGKDRAAGPPPAPRLDAPALRPGSFRIWISDLLFPGRPEELLRVLLRQRGSGVLFAPFCAGESSPVWHGVCDFEDVETGQIETRDVDEPLLRRYGAAYRAHFAAWKEEAARHHLPMARVPAALPLDQALATGAVAARAVEPAD